MLQFVISRVTFESLTWAKSMVVMIYLFIHINI